MGYLDIVQIREEAIYILSMYMYTHLIYILSIYTYSSNYKCIRALNDSISSFFWRSERYSSSNCDFSRTEVRTKCVTCQNRVRRPTNTTIIGIPVKSWTSELRLYMYNVYVHVYVCVCVCVCVCIAYLISGKWDLLSWPVKRCKNPTIMWGQKEAYYHGKRDLLSVKRCRRLLSCEVMRIWTAFFEANKTYNHGKRDLLSWQKRPNIMVIETYYHGHTWEVMSIWAASFPRLCAATLRKRRQVYVWASFDSTFFGGRTISMCRPSLVRVTRPLVERFSV